jgi:hypothetical protein
MRNSNKYVLRGLQNEINVEVQDNDMFYVDFRMSLMWKYKIIVRRGTVINMFYVDFRMCLMGKYKLIVR